MSSLLTQGIIPEGLNLPEDTKASRKRVKWNDEANIF